jgi:hypothetical protein
MQALYSRFGNSKELGYALYGFCRRVELSKEKERSMAFFDPPPGWYCLQALAQTTADSDSVSQIVAEMNRILDRQEGLAEPIETETA